MLTTLTELFLSPLQRNRISIASSLKLEVAKRTLLRLELLAQL